MNFHMPVEMNLLGKKPYYNCCIGMVSPQNEFSYAGQDCPFVKKLFYSRGTGMVSPQCESSYACQEYSFVKKLFSHLLHWYGFSPV